MTFEEYTQTMRHFNIYVKEKASTQFLNLTKNLRYINKVEIDTRPTKKDIAKNINKGFRELRLIEKRKLKTTSLIKFLNGL